MLLAHGAVVFVLVDGLCRVLVDGNGECVVNFDFAIEVDANRDDAFAREFGGYGGKRLDLRFAFNAQGLCVEYDGKMSRVEETTFEQIGAFALQRQVVAVVKVLVLEQFLVCLLLWVFAMAQVLVLVLEFLVFVHDLMHNLVLLVMENLVHFFHFLRFLHFHYHVLKEKEKMKMMKKAFSLFLTLSTLEHQMVKFCCFVLCFLSLVLRFVLFSCNALEA